MLHVYFYNQMYSSHTLSYKVLEMSPKNKTRYYIFLCLVQIMNVIHTIKFGRYMIHLSMKTVH